VKQAATHKRNLKMSGKYHTGETPKPALEYPPRLLKRDQGRQRFGEPRYRAPSYRPPEPQGERPRRADTGVHALEVSEIHQGVVHPPEGQPPKKEEKEA
jgi:hypothetical protein